MKSGFMNQRDEVPAWGEDLPESVWFAVTDFGRKLRFTMAPQVDEVFALRYAQNHPSEFSLAQFVGPERAAEHIIAVERGA